nr:glycosyltransferase [Cryobacterium roopkundense]
MSFVLLLASTRADSIIVSVGVLSLAAGLLGWIEDVRGLPVRVRAAAQLAIGVAASAALQGSGSTPMWLVPIFAIGIAGYINVANFMDGLDGISGLHGVVVGATYGVLGLIFGFPWLIAAGGILAVAFLGFLPWNLMRGGVFLGDVGSYLLGGSIGIVAVAALMHGVPLVAVLAPLTIYLVDAGGTLLKRILKRARWFEAHREHLYQRIQGSGIAHLRVAVLTASLSAVAGGFGLVAAVNLSGWWVSALGVLAVTAAYLAIGAWILRSPGERLVPGVAGVGARSDLMNSGEGHSAGSLSRRMRTETSTEIFTAKGNEYMSEPKQIWIVNHYATEPAKDLQAGRHYFLSQHLPSVGWQATIIAASTTHPRGKQTHRRFQQRRMLKSGAALFVWLRSNSYEGNGPLRVLNMILFTASLLAPGSLRGLKRPDAIVGSSVHPLAAWGAMRLAKRYAVPFIFEPRDLWPESLVALGRLKRGSALEILLGKLELKLIRGSVGVVSPLPGVGKYIEGLGIDKPFSWVSNGVDVPTHLPDIAAVEDRDFTCMYLGAMGNANALEPILLAFNDFASLPGNERARLRMIGDGPKRLELADLAAGLACGERISFEGPVPKSDVIYMANQADCLVANMFDLEIYKYGISLNKLFDYMYAGRPIIFAAKALNNPILESDGGICVRPNDQQQIAQAMSQIQAMTPAMRLQMGIKARAHVMSEYSYLELAGTFGRALDRASATFLEEPLPAVAAS